MGKKGTQHRKRNNAERAARSQQRILDSRRRALESDAQLDRAERQLKDSAAMRAFLDLWQGTAVSVRMVLARQYLVESRGRSQTEAEAETREKKARQLVDDPLRDLDFCDFIVKHLEALNTSQR